MKEQTLEDVLVLKVSRVIKLLSINLIYCNFFKKCKKLETVPRIIELYFSSMKELQQNRKRQSKMDNLK